MDHDIIYKPSFVLFWGVMLAISVLCGILTVVFTLCSMLMLIWHEHAHLKACEKRGVKINSVSFTWLGGEADVDIVWYANDAIPVLMAGVKNTGIFAFSLGAFVVGLYSFPPLGLNFAQNPYLNLLNSVAVFAVLLFITNILPITVNTKTKGVISTDGWACVRIASIRNEMWNDGKIFGMAVDEENKLRLPFN